jgi:hypothetical protein
MQEVGSQNRKDESSERTVLQASKQSRESLASSSHVSSSCFPPCSRACSAMRKKHQPSKYQASTSSSSEAMIPCKTVKAGVNSDNSRKSLVKFNRLEMGGSLESSTKRASDGALTEETGWTCLRPGLSKRARLSQGAPWPHRVSVETCERTQGSATLPYFPGRLGAQT